ncbi:glycosyltransferase family 4 protein [bacterium]|jgi:mannosylglucosylglycerate synthase|nr:glycosyltransferase family 4 protein [bacterium]
MKVFIALLTIAALFTNFIKSKDPNNEMYATKGKKIAIVHYRVGKTDGVSLEIEKRKKILESLGNSVCLISGPLQDGADFVISELEFEHPEVVQVKENSFKYFNRNDLTTKELAEKIVDISDIIEEKFLRYHDKEKFDLILIHNIFSLGIHLPAALAFGRIAEQTTIPIIATHHDYYWERKEYATPTSDLIHNFLEYYVPLYNKNIIHVCINSLAEVELKRQRGIVATVFPDVFDFSQKLWVQDAYNSDLIEKVGIKHNDIFVLQATRIVERKGIELAIQFVKELEKQKDSLIGKTLYNGKLITKDSDIVLVLPGFTEKFAQLYLERLKKEIKRAGIKAIFIDNIVEAQRKTSDTEEKIYSLWDTYVFADLITYPSLFEGWGNQFIEAVFAKKPIVVFEYPVFKADIKQEGYHVISLGDKIDGKNNLGSPFIKHEKIEKIAEKAIRFLTSPNTNDLLEENFSIGGILHGKTTLQIFLKQQLNKFFHRKKYKKYLENFGM